MAVIGFNSAAVNAAYYLNQNSMALNTSIQELASGSRLADPTTDAAGVAVSGNLTATVARLGAASQGAQNVVSFAQTTDGFLSTIQQQLSRMARHWLMRFRSDSIKQAAERAGSPAEAVGV